MRYYATKTKDDFIATIMALELDGCFWFTGERLLYQKKAWNKFRRNTVISVDTVRRVSVISHSNLAADVTAVVPPMLII